jgi:hypothetical protein
MTKYAYQIQGALEDPNKNIRGFRVLVCTVDYLNTVDAPVEIFDKDTLEYLKYRFSICEYMNIQKLPISIQNKIRGPLGKWLDKWVLENINGDTINRKSTDA